MKQRTPSISNIKRKNCIDEMDALLDQISDFKRLIETTENITDSTFKQEYRLFKQHVEWVIEDIDTSTSSPIIAQTNTSS